MIKKLVGLLLAMVMVVGLAACSTSGETANGTASTTTTEVTTVETAQTTSADTSETVDFPEMTLVLSSSATDSELGGICTKEISALLEEATDGKVTVDVNLNSSLFTQDQEFTALMQGNLDMCYSNLSYLTDYMPELSIYDMAYLFKDMDHWRAWYASDDWAEQVEKIAEQTGVRILASSCFGMRCVNLVEDKKVTCRADLQNIKMREMNNKAYLFIGKALGANPVGLNMSDVYLSLQTGAVDGEENPVEVIVANSLQEVTGSLTKTNHVMATNRLCISEAVWDSLSAELQQVLKEVAQEVADNLTQRTEEQTDEFLKELEEAGMKIYDLTAEERAAYSQEVQEYYKTNGGDLTADWDMDLIDIINSYAD